MSLDHVFRTGQAADMAVAMSQATEAVVSDMEAAIEAQKVRIRQLEIALANSQREASSLSLGLAGCVAQGKVLKAELKKIAPNNHLFQSAGGVYDNGSKRTNLDVFYEKAVDAKAFELKLPLAGKAYRPFAK